MKEIEILIEVQSTKEWARGVLVQFEYLGAKEVLDVYFVDPVREMLKPDREGRLEQCYRFRLKEDTASVAYKVDHFDSGMQWTHSDEYETGVENFDTALQIQKHLGFEELVRIHNTKYTYMTNEYEIVLEDVQDLGLFLEIEKLAQVPDEKISDTKEEMRVFLKSLNIQFGQEQNAGKPELMLRIKNKPSRG